MPAQIAPEPARSRGTAALKPLSPSPRRRARSWWGGAALLSWLALALHASGLVPLDILNPGSLAGCGAQQLKSESIPATVSHGLTLRRGDETVHLARGTRMDLLGRQALLVGADRSANVVVLEDTPTRDAATRLVAVPLTNNTLVVKPLRKGGRIAAIVVSGVGGLVAGAAAGAAIGVNSGSGGSGQYGGNVGGMVLGCLAGGVALGATGTTTAAVVTRKKAYVLAPGEWQIVEDGR